MTRIDQLLNESVRLEPISDTARLDTELLLCFCIDQSRSYLRAWPDKVISKEQALQFEALISQREQGVPVAHLIGERGFWTLDLKVNNSTLIPRPETELLVETALELLSNSSQARVLDLGTGTGAVALAIASEKPDCQILACDKSSEAVKLAEENRSQHSLKKVRVIESDWFDAIEEQVFELIVSNPPYIDASDPHLNEGDVRFEPHSALVAEHSGMADIEKIIAAAKTYLTPGGWLVLEHGYDQAEQTKRLFEDHGYHNAFCRKDLAGLDRVSGARWQVEGESHE